MKIRRLILSMFVLSTIGIASCSKNVESFPVTGTVLYKGKPAVKALVVFQLRGTENELKVPLGSGVVQEDGTYQLELPNQDGMLPGECVVTVVWREPPQAKGKNPLGVAAENVKTVDRLSGKYSDPAKSKIIFRIERKKNELPPIELD